MLPVPVPSAQIDGKFLHNKLPKSRQQKPPALHKDYDDVQKKLMHRYTERQRRQEMAILCASLRSLLPLEYIKGKRSVSDHINEAVKYFKHLQNRIEELGAKRDELRKLSDFNDFDPPTNLTVSQCFGEVEVVLSASLTAQMLPLSRVLEILLKDGLTVFNCVYTKVEERQIYTIHIEVSDLMGVDPSALQRKLAEAIPSSSNSSL